MKTQVRKILIKKFEKPFIKGHAQEQKENLFDKKLVMLKKKFLDRTSQYKWKRTLLIIVVEDIELWLTTKQQYIKIRHKYKKIPNLGLLSQNYDSKLEKQAEILQSALEEVFTR